MSRNQTPITPQTPLSFKTVPGRNRTQKWNKAPTYSYEGDDWGGYDPYDEYGHEEPPPPVPTQAPYAGQPSKPRGRANSFERDDELRQFSAPVAPTAAEPIAFPAYDQRGQRGASQEPSSASSGGRRSNDAARSRSRPRDFTNPEHVPPPLTTRGPPPPGEWFPPRKSSLNGKNYDQEQAATEARAVAAEVAAQKAANTEKPLPFIRPSDIYKRIPDEIRRQSEEGSRPSMDSLQREAASPPPALAPVAEVRESRLYNDGDVPNMQQSAGNARALSPASRNQLPSLQTERTPTDAPAERRAVTRPTLPPVTFSGFGEDVLNGKGSTSSQAGRATPDAAEGTRNVASLNTSNTQSSFNSIQNTPTSTRAPPGRDPADEILAERQYSIPVDAIANQNQSGLQHQPSHGFRSAVHQAFDRADDSTLSRDSSNATSSAAGVGRSDTNSTAGISPIMSRVPPTFQQRQHDQQVPPIAEEQSTTPTGSRPSSGLQGMHHIQRKPSPSSQGINRSADVSDFEPGYRRSLDPPSNGTSPARTPGLETTAHRRLSTPLSAEPVVDHDPPDVADQAAEVPEPSLEPAETPAREPGELGSASTMTAALPGTRRGRSGTDYSIREADIADTVNSSPDIGAASPNMSIAEAQRSSQKLFLETHGTPMSPAIRDPSRSRTGTPTTGRSDSPAKSRVKEIADKYHEIHEASRRNSAISVGSSKSSWSNFEAPPLQRKETSQSQLASENSTATEEPSSSALAPPRPELGREESFKPDVPGGWISSAPTPSAESAPGAPEFAARDVTPRTSQFPQDEEPVDLTPTTKKYKLRESQDGQPVSAFDSLRNVGDQLGASLISSVGVGHQTRDFASAEPAAPVNQPEIQSKPARGSMPIQPPLLRQQTDSSDAMTSVASSVPPTPPSKDNVDSERTPHANRGNGGYFSTVAPLRLKSREASPEHAQSPSQRTPGPTTLSNTTRASDVDNDELGHEIMRSLDPHTRQDADEDVARTQDALDAPDNERRVEQGRSPLPAMENSSSRPGFLNTRFSWENTPNSQNLLPSTEPAPEQEPHSPEIKPEMAYERPRDKELHVVNTNVSVESPVEPSPVPVLREPATKSNDMPHPSPLGSAPPTEYIVSPVSKSQEHLTPDSNVQAGSPSQPTKDVAPSPVSDNLDTFGSSSRLPSYYLGAHDETLDVPDALEKDAASASSMKRTASRSSVSLPATAEQPKSNVAIPPFRNILAMKTGDERIKTYNETRQTFADMNTGLNAWLNKMLIDHPEHANLSTSNSGFRPPALQSSPSGIANFKRGHKPSPSLANFKNRFASSGDQQRSGSIGSNNAETSESPRPPTSGLGGGAGIDTEKLQQRSKEFMKSAGVFGGKAQAGAKGLFAKGKSRFGTGSVRKKSSNEVPSSTTTSRSKPASSSPFATISTSAALAPPSATNANAPRELRSSQAQAPMNQSNLRDVPEGETAPTPEQPTTDPSAATATTLAPPSALRQEPSSSPSLSARPVTPSSTTTSRSRPLSQVFERLREKSRNSSASRGGSRSRSRPASLVLNTSNLESASDTNTGPGLVDFWTWKGNEASTSAEGARDYQMAHSDAQIQHSRVESWNDPSAQLPPKTPERDSGSERLGVLPSPAPTMATFEEGRRASKETPSGRASGRARDEDDGEAPLETVPSAGESAEGTAAQASNVEGVDTSVEPARSGHEASFGGTPLSVGQGVANDRELSAAKNDLPNQRPSYEGRMYAAGEEYSPKEITEAGAGNEVAEATRQKPPSSTASAVVRPQQHRRVSDLQLLPSQRRLAPLDTAQAEDEPAAASTTLPVESSENDRTETSPVTIKQIPSPTAAKDDMIDDSTPVAGRRMWQETAEMTGHEREIAKMEKEIEEAAASSPTELTTSTPIAVPTLGNKCEDARSEVSAEEGAQNEAHGAAAYSRQSSVSSLGAQEAEPTSRNIATATAQEDPSPEPEMSAQAVPAGPTGSMQASSHGAGLQSLTTAVARSPDLGGPQQRQHAFATRQYTGHRPAMEDRPLSYMPLPRDESGAPHQETITTADAATDVPIDLSGISGPPAGTPPFQQHPVFRNGDGAVAAVQRPEKAQPQSSVTEIKHTPSTTANLGDARNSKRLSGIFKRRPQSYTGEATVASPPSPSKITDQHGLEDVHVHGSVSAEPSRPPTRQRDSQGKRRSWIGEAFSSRRSSSVLKMEEARESSVAAPVAAPSAIPPVQAVGEGSKRNTLRKPQRAASTAVADGDLKKKRFSRLGSLFGRSSSTAGAAPRQITVAVTESNIGDAPKPATDTAPKPKRLTKMAPASREASTRADTPQQMPRPNSRAVTGNVVGYEAYEAMRRRDMPAFQENAASAGPLPPDRQPTLPAVGDPNAAAPAESRPPPDGWYGPSSNAPAGPEQFQQVAAPIRPEYRSLHSSGDRRDKRIPEAFMPVDASFNRPVEPIGPPPGQEPSFRGFSSSNVPTLQSFPERRQSQSVSPPPAGRTPSEQMDMMMDPQRPRQMSYASNVSGRSEYGAAPPTLSPARTRDSQAYAQLEGRSDIVRSPVQQYNNQQAPWAVTLPRGEEQTPWPTNHHYGQQPPIRNRTPSWTNNRAGQYTDQYAGPTPRQTYPPPQQYFQQQRPQYATRPPPAAQRVGVPWEDQQPTHRPNTFHPASTPPQEQQWAPRLRHIPPPGWGPPSAQQHPPPMQQMRPPAQQQQHIYHQQRGPPPQQNRYYAGPPRRPPSSSGYVGRREDPTVGEEELVMRGASYPGQEWMPSGMTRE